MLKYFLVINLIGLVAVIGFFLLPPWQQGNHYRADLNIARHRYEIRRRQMDDPVEVIERRILSIDNLPEMLGLVYTLAEAHQLATHGFVVTHRRWDGIGQAVLRIENTGAFDNVLAYLKNLEGLGMGMNSLEIEGDQMTIEMYFLYGL